MHRDRLDPIHAGRGTPAIRRFGDQHLLICGMRLLAPRAVSNSTAGRLDQDRAHRTRSSVRRSCSSLHRLDDHQRIAAFTCWPTLRTPSRPAPQQYTVPTIGDSRLTDAARPTRRLRQRRALAGRRGAAAARCVCGASTIGLPACYCGAAFASSTRFVSWFVELSASWRTSSTSTAWSLFGTVRRLLSARGGSSASRYESAPNPAIFRARLTTRLHGEGLAGVLVDVCTSLTASSLLMRRDRTDGV